MISKVSKIALAALFALPLGGFAQTEQKAMVDSKNYDNWYIGVNGGLSTKTTHNKWIENANSNAGLRVGHWFTPVFGFAVEGNAYFGDKPQPSTGTIVNYVNTDLAATINLSNMCFGYKGEPRVFELIAVPAIGMGHVFANKAEIAHGLNDMTGKLALDFAFNIDKKKCLQLYLEPALLYSIYGNASGSNSFDLNMNRSHFQLNLGLVYKFKNTNGTHNFKYAEPMVVTDMAEVNRLRGIIADLEAENKELKNRPAPCIAPRIITRDVTVLEPVVVFPVSSSKIEKLQYANIERVANYMKENKDAKIKVTGYASTEGSDELNQKLSEARAEAVKHALIDKYGIASDRIEICGMGATDEQSAERAYNRVAVINLVQ